MQFSIHSFYWENKQHYADRQKQVFTHFGYDVQQTCATSMQHGVWLDSVLHAATDDVILIADIDAIPMMPHTVPNDIALAASGALVGCRGMPNHIPPLRDYAGAWWFAIRPDVWRAMGSPSAQANDMLAIPANETRVDVAQRLTDSARTKGIPLKLHEPINCAHPEWDLPDKPKAYGVGTLYENGTFHLFNSRKFSNTGFFDAACDMALKN
jgi:hypothetical protein